MSQVFIKEVVTRYGPINPFWNIVSSIHMNEAAPLTPDAMVQITRLAGVSVRQTMKNAKRYENAATKLLAASNS
ncbi:MAG: hypothetical protein EBX52_13985, partial [Proteobacteria bacterium]|nr:hypothetical protein [Pseudomonadota bacterium]